MEHLFLMSPDHTQRRTTVGRTPLDEWSARRRDLYLTTHDTHNRQISMHPVLRAVCDLETSRIGAPYIYNVRLLRVKGHDHDQQHCYHHAPTVKPEAATAVVELLMMGVWTPETCWAVNKRQVINWKKMFASSWWFIWIVWWDARTYEI